MKLWSLILMLLIAACSPSPRAQNGLTPMPELEELGEGELRIAMDNYLISSKSPLNSQYEYAFVDLDNNGRRDALVLMKLPYTHWCGWSGCPLLVFRANIDDFSFISRSENIRGPIFVAQTVSNGLRDIVIRASGTNTPDRNVFLSFDGQNYTSNALAAPQYHITPSTETMDKLFR